MSRADTSPVVLLVGGPNGAGKTTISRSLIAETVGIVEFVNADVIAMGLSGFDPDRAAFQAGRIMLARLRELAHSRASFAFESTLASRTFAPWLRTLVTSGYQFHLVYLWLESPELAVERVRRRVLLGGHAVPEDTIRRRYFRSCSNFVHLYAPLARTWRAFDNSYSSPRIIAQRRPDSGLSIFNQRTYNRMLGAANAANEDNEAVTG